LFGSPAPLLLGRKPTEKKKRVHKPSGSGLAPSPPQKSAPQHVDIITLDSDGEEIAVERRVRNPKAHQPKAPIKTAIDSVISLDSDDDGPTEQKFPVTNKPKLAAKTPTKPKKVLELPLSKDGTRGQGLRTAQNAERDMPWNAPRDLIKPIDPVGDLPAPSQPQKTVTAPKTVRRSANHPPASTPSNHIGASFLSLPPQILEAIQKTGDLSVALPYLSPKSRSALETILCAEKLTRGKQKSETHQRDTPPTPSTLGDLDLEEEEFAQAFESLSLSPSPLKKRTTKAIDGLEERVPLQQTSRSASAAVQTHPNAPIASTSASLTALPLPSPCLARLLEISKQAEPYDFSSFVETFPFDPIHGEAAGQVIFRKIGEASFSEVFGIGNVVLKIVPITVTKDGKTFDSIEEGQMLPDVSDVADVLKEVIMTKAMGEIHPGFIRLLG
jgi:serine/threonine-protein kinase haspin